MPGENPGAYHEANNRIREKYEREKQDIEAKKEAFEISKETFKKRKGLDIYSLRQKILTGQSLESLKNDLKNALGEGDISRESFDQAMKSLSEQKEVNPIDPDLVPFSKNTLAQYLEGQPLGDNIGSDIVGFLYGFFVQGSAILVIIAWKILTDFLFLPRDIFREISKLNNR